MTDFDGKKYVAVYDQFKARKYSNYQIVKTLASRDCLREANSKMNDNIATVTILLQVGPGDGYTLTLGGFNDALSTLGDSLTSSTNINGMTFVTK